MGSAWFDAPGCLLGLRRLAADAMTRVALLVERGSYKCPEASAENPHRTNSQCGKQNIYFNAQSVSIMG